MGIISISACVESLMNRVNHYINELDKQGVLNVENIIEYKYKDLFNLEKIVKVCPRCNKQFIPSYNCRNVQQFCGDDCRYNSTQDTRKVMKQDGRYKKIDNLRKLIYEKKYKYFIIFFTLSIFCNIHISIISLIFIIFYSASRKYKDFSELVNSMLYLILSGILCCLLSGIVIINSINGPFFNEDLSLKFPEFSIGNPFDYFCHFLPRTSLSFYSLYGKNTDICIGAFLIFFTFAYLFNKRIIAKKLFKYLC